MSFFVALKEQNIKGIFNNKNLISQKDNCFIMSCKTNANPINNEDTLFIFFQYIDNEYKNLKIFSTLCEAINYRDKHFNYGHIIGMKQDTYYDSFLNMEYINVKELN